LGLDGNVNNEMMLHQTTFETFLQLDIRVGTIVEAMFFEKANKPAYLLTIDFGEQIGIKKSSAQITKLYQPQNLVGKQIIAVVNFPPKQIANIMSECLVLGVTANDGSVVLLQPEQETLNGLKIG
jgi:tRNA-binding protein